MISRRTLLGALGQLRVPEWTLIERVQELAVVDPARPLRRTEVRTTWSVVVHHDVAHGRGTARLELTTFEGSALEAIDEAITIAAASIGAPWRATPPAAPAKVRVLDPALEKGDLADAGALVFAKLARLPAGASLRGSVELLRERVTVLAHSGFQTRWSASSARAQLIVTAGERSLELQREARRVGDLELDAAVSEGLADLGQLATARSPTPGRCALILRPEAFLHGGGLGMWSVFADQATAEIERQGLLRYRVAAPIAPGADQLAEPLSITSDGTLDFATRSAPVGDDGDAIRRFALVERGISVGLGMSLREAARRRVDPNGGVRNLVISSGTWTETAPPGRTFDVRRLRSLAIDPYTGDASLELGLAVERIGDDVRPITGGTVRLDLVRALARARRSAAPFRRGAYLGPAAILIDDAELVL